MSPPKKDGLDTIRALARAPFEDTSSSYASIRLDPPHDPRTRAEVLADIVEAEARGDFEAARQIREAANKATALAYATERAQALGRFILGSDHLYQHIFDPEKCCLRVGASVIEHENMCCPPPKPRPPGGIREIRCILDSYPPKCGYCRKSLYVLGPL